MRVECYIGSDRLDTFQRESIDVVESVVDLADLTARRGTYSRTFTVPANDTNNKILRYYFNPDIFNQFDARIKQDGRIDLNGSTYKVGKWTLLKVQVKKGKAVAYTLSFFGNLVDISKKLGSARISDLTALGSYNHAFTYDNVRSGLLSKTFFGGDLVYTLLVKKRYFVDSSDGVPSNESQQNISFLAGEDAGIQWEDLRPSLKLIRIIEAIEQQYDLQFTRDFFGSTEFTDLLLWLNNNTDTALGKTVERINFDTGDDPFFDYTQNQGTYVNSEAGGGGYWNFELSITPAAGFEDVPYRVFIYIDNAEYGTGESTQGGAGDYSWDGPKERPQNDPFLVYYLIETQQPFTFDVTLRSTIIFSFGATTYTSSTNADQSISVQVQLENEFPDLQLIELLKGLISAFNLVIFPQDDGTIYVNTIDNFYLSGNYIDITPYVDNTEYEVRRGKLLNPIKYTFSEPTTLLNVQYTKNNGRSYGNEELILREDPADPSSALLDGEEFTIELPFEQVLLERLTDVASGSLTKIQYGLVTDSQGEGSNPTAYIHYAPSVALTNQDNIAIQDDNGDKQLLTGSVNTPSACNTLVSPSSAFLFSAELNTWDATRVLTNLYSRHWNNYIRAIFDPKKREYSYTTYLPYPIIKRLALNSILQIQDYYFRISSFALSLPSNKVELELVTGFVLPVGSTGGAPNSRRLVTANYNTDNTTLSIPNLSGSTVTKVDTGDGTEWFFLSDASGLLRIDFAPNTGNRREAEVVVETSNSKTTLLVIQLDGSDSQEGNVTVDRTDITADDTNITADET